MRKGLLTIDEREALQSLTENDGYKALLIVIDALVRDQQDAVLKLNIDDGVDPVIHAKLRSEGAAKLRADIHSLKARLKAQQDK